MKITALVENQTNCDLKAKHGLSLYIETKQHKLLFDLGSDDTLFQNAQMRGIDLSQVDTVIISHGHMDHGGALQKFLKINTIAKIYIQKRAFLPHFSKVIFMKVFIGIENKLADHPQIKSVNGDLIIDKELELFVVKQTDKCYSNANDILMENKKKDNFLHEQNLLIHEEKTSLIMGCGHTGIVNIMEKAADNHPAVCIGGYHLLDPITNKMVSKELLDNIADELQKYKDTRFYTCHCTGFHTYHYLKTKMNNLYYLSCGEKMEI